MTVNPSWRLERAKTVFSLIGNTPMAELRLEAEGVRIFAKCEFANPSGSVKDRLANMS